MPVYYSYNVIVRHDVQACDLSINFDSSLSFYRVLVTECEIYIKIANHFGSVCDFDEILQVVLGDSCQQYQALMRVS